MALIATADRFNFVNSTPSPRETWEDKTFRADVAEKVETERERLAAEAQKIIDFVRSDDFDGTGEYVQNLKAVFSGETVSGRNVGLAISAIGAYHRWLGKQAERKAREETRSGSEWQGEVGEKKHEVVGVVTNIRLIEGDYGTTTLYEILAGTNIYKWFSSNSRGWKVGDNVHITGTIKKHDEFNGTKSTVLTRCKEV